MNADACQCLIIDYRLEILILEVLKQICHDEFTEDDTSLFRIIIIWLHLRRALSESSAAPFPVIFCAHPERVPVEVSAAD